MNERRLRVVALVVGLLLVGEVLTLVATVRYPTPGDPWVTSRNDLLLALDLIVGALVGLFAIRSSVEEWPERLGSLLLVGICAQIYRLWQVVAGVPNPYAATDTLVATTVVDLLVLGVLFVGFAFHRVERSRSE